MFHNSTMLELLAHTRREDDLRPHRTHPRRRLPRRITPSLNPRRLLASLRPPRRTAPQPR